MPTTTRTATPSDINTIFDSGFYRRLGWRAVADPSEGDIRFEKYRP